MRVHELMCVLNGEHPDAQVYFETDDGGLLHLADDVATGDVDIYEQTVDGATWEAWWCVAGSEALHGHVKSVDAFVKRTERGVILIA